MPTFLLGVDEVAIVGVLDRGTTGMLRAGFEGHAPGVLEGAEDGAIPLLFRVDEGVADGCTCLVGEFGMCIVKCIFSMRST
jgi:hypothetical protein